MKATRQDAWTEDEDTLLAEIVLRHIREGKTQLEAFKEVAEKLSRTSAACGFRWNAAIRKRYEDAIELAKKERKHGMLKQTSHVDETNKIGDHPIDTAITLLEKMRANIHREHEPKYKEQQGMIEQLKKENDELKERLSRYEQAWQEMAKLWNWVSGNKDGLDINE
ncbi:MAG TPA: RsfA family transcriptional regulator [Bacillota bacterium]|nr:RsfA family transcriptional regulator [Bacillota bacterium]